MELHEHTISEISDLLRSRKISSVELTTEFLNRIKTMDEKVHAFLTVDESKALAAAEHADMMIARGEISPLTGIPLSIKDLICTKELRTTSGSKILENFIPQYSAHVVEKLAEQGCVVIGKVNMDEFGMGSTTENSGFMPTHNPWDLTRFPGGSSGGSAASVASGMCLGSLGSDTGGSIRQPASHCGITGLKPTYGRVSRFGLIAYASSLDQIGPLAKDARDCASILQTISGYDKRDSTSVKKNVPDFRPDIPGDASKPLKNLKIGIPVEYNNAEGLSVDVSKALKQSIKILENLGAETIEVSLPNTKYVVAAYYIIAPSEASANLARFDGVRFGYRDMNQKVLKDMYRETKSKGFGDEVKRRIIVGTYALSSGYYDAFYKKATQVRTLIVNDFKKAFETCDLLVTPVAPEAAGKIGEASDDPLKMYLSDIFTLSANLTGIPGMSVPCGFTETGLPIGMQLMGKHFDEKSLINTAHAFQQVTDYHKQRPKL